MRTTITLEADVARKLKAYAHARRTTFKQAVNEVIRRGLGAQERKETSVPFVVVPHTGGFLPGIDPMRLKQQLDDEDVEEFLRKSDHR